MLRQATHVRPSSISLKLLQHLRQCNIHIVDAEFYRWPCGASAIELPDLQIVVARSLSDEQAVFHYVTAGASIILDQPGYGLEFCLQSRVQTDLNVELLAMVVHMHSRPQHRLGVGHTLNIGRSIEPNSRLDRLLVSLPYPYGADFEFAHFEGGGHARVLWLLPICQSEERMRHELGLEAFESTFERTEVNFLDNFRDCVA